MSETLLPFVVVRAPAPFQQDDRSTLSPYEGIDDTELRTVLRTAESNGDHEAARAAAEEWWYIQDLDGPPLPSPVLSSLTKYLYPTTHTTVKEVASQAALVFDSDQEDILASDSYVRCRGALADALCAAEILEPGGRRSAPLEQWLRVLEVVRRGLTMPARENLASISGDVVDATIVIPFDIMLAREMRGHFAELEAFPTSANVRVAGIADLLVVRRTLTRYERGEIAYVENCLPGERFERTFRRSNTVDTLLFTEDESTIEQDRDLQTTERFELEAEVSHTVQEQLNAQASFSVTGAYGTVNYAVGGAVAYGRSVQDAQRTASRYARETVDKSVTRVRTRTLTRRSTRTIRTVEETSLHRVEAPADQGIVGFYQYLNKIYEAQIINYGKRLLLDIFVPEPGAYLREVRATQVIGGLRRTKPVRPRIKQADGSDKELDPTSIDWDVLQPLAAEYGVEGLGPPPPPTLILGATLEVPHTDKQYNDEAPLGDPGVWLPAIGATKVSQEIAIPDGYEAVEAKWSGQELPIIRKSPLSRDASGGGSRRQWSGSLELTTSVSVGAGTFPLAQTTQEVAGFTGKLPVGVITSGAGLVVTFKVSCKRRDSLYAVWQTKSFEAVMRAYRALLSEYEDDLARVESETPPVGGNPAAHKEAMLDELRRIAVTVMQGVPRLTGSKALSDPSADAVNQSPAYDLNIMSSEGGNVLFFEQGFEWPNTSCVLYPYFWGRGEKWQDLLNSSDPADPDFQSFLRAGYARIQIPVRPGNEISVMKYLSGGPAVLQPAGSVPTPLVPLSEELKAQTDPGFTPGQGRVSIKKDAKSLMGAGTKFTSTDVGREVRVELTTGTIAVWISTEEVLLKEEWPSQGADDAFYDLGPWIVGAPWEIQLPTELVVLNDATASLPGFG